MQPVEPAEPAQDDGRVPDSLVEILFLLTLFGVFAWVSAVLTFVL